MNDFDKILKEGKEDPDILGLVLVGSRGKGFENENSDYDMVMIVKDEVIKKICDEYKIKNLTNLDLSIHSFSNFKNFADWGTPESWDRYNYAHVKILVDKTDGELEKIIYEKGHISQEKFDSCIDLWIDGYVNGVYRSVKCIRDGNFFGAHIEAVNSILDLLTLVFAINYRHRPFLGYVEKELKKYPLKNLPWTVDDFLSKIKKVLETADLKTQQEILCGIEKLSREMGYGKIFDSWEGKDKWAMTFVAEQK